MSGLYWNRDSLEIFYLIVPIRIGLISTLVVVGNLYQNSSVVFVNIISIEKWTDLSIALRIRLFIWIRFEYKIDFIFIFYFPFLSFTRRVRRNRKIRSISDIFLMSTKNTIRLMSKKFCLLRRPSISIDNDMVDHNDTHTKHLLLDWLWRVCLCLDDYGSYDHSYWGKILLRPLRHQSLTLRKAVHSFVFNQFNSLMFSIQTLSKPHPNPIHFHP